VNDITKKQIAINTLLETYNKLHEINKGNVDYSLQGSIQNIKNHPNQWTIKQLTLFNNNLLKQIAYNLSNNKEVE